VPGLEGWGDGMTEIHIHIHVPAQSRLVDHRNFVIESTTWDDVVRVRLHHKSLKWSQSSLAFHIRELDDLIDALGLLKTIWDKA